ncbi:MAG: hypothetical protein QOE55_4326 [Acidobacteriaceae bacterium]|jgi:hypothetical protein|nr:hypothetical protein [Acidobacteriaceae bacterium]
MTSPSFSLQPPRLAVWLVNLFTVSDNAEAIMGDLLEEFSQIAHQAGVVFARRWYWRHSLKTIVHLIFTAYRAAPWLTSAGVVGGSLTGRLVKVVGPAIFAVLVRYQIPEHHFNVYVFFATTGIDIGYLIVFLLVGCIAAIVAKERGMVAATTLGLISAAMSGIAVVSWVLQGHWALSRLTWNFADTFAILIGGAIVRTHRSAQHLSGNENLRNT